MVVASSVVRCWPSPATSATSIVSRYHLVKYSSETAGQNSRKVGMMSNHGALDRPIMLQMEYNESRSREAKPTLKLPSVRDCRLQPPTEAGNRYGNVDRSCENTSRALYHRPSHHTRVCNPKSVR